MFHYKILYLLTEITNAGNVRSRNMYQKLVQLVLYQKLARVSVNLVQVFFWYKFLARNRTQLYFSTKLCGT